EFRRVLFRSSVDLCRQLPPRSLFGGDRTASCALDSCPAGHRIFHPHRPAICDCGKQGRIRKEGELYLLHGRGGAGLCVVDLAFGRRRVSGPDDSRHPRAGNRFSAADLFLRSCHGLSQAPALAAGSGGKCRRLDCRLQGGWLAVARLHRRPGGRPVRSPHALERQGKAAAMTTTLWIILAGAVATYLTRIGGHLVISRFESIHPRVEAGLNAVPAAVLTTLVAPALLDAGPAEWAAILVAGLVALRGGLMSMFLAGAAVLVFARQFLA